jgi:hypothetical protein
MHNAYGWEMIETDGEFEWLPLIKKFALRPGVNGVKQTRKGVDYLNSKVTFEQNGWTFIMPEDVDGGYLVEYEGRWGKVYADKWSTPRSLGPGQNAKIIWDHDREAWNDFRRSLVPKLGPPDPSIIDMKVTLQGKRARRRERETHIPSVAADVKKQAAKLDAMKASKPKRTRRKKAAPKKEATP